MAKYLSLVSVVACAVLAADAQGPPGPNSIEQRLASRVDGYAVSAQTFVKALHTVASDFKIPMAIEWVRDASALAPVSLTWSDVTLREIIDDAAAAYPGYSVTVRDDIVHVFPEAFLRSTRDVLGTRVGPLDVADSQLGLASARVLRSRARTVLRPDRTLGGEASSIATGLGGDRRVSFKAANPTIREVLHAFAVQAETVWIVTYSGASPKAGAYPVTLTLDGNPVAEQHQPLWVFLPWRATYLLK